MTISDEQTKALWQDLLEKDDRTSPSEYPDMALITFEEFAAALASAELRGKIEGLKIARVLIWTTSQKGSGISAIAAISARLASLQPEVAKREEGV